MDLKTGIRTRTLSSRTKTLPRCSSAQPQKVIETYSQLIHSPCLIILVPRHASGIFTMMRRTHNPTAMKPKYAIMLALAFVSIALAASAAEKRLWAKSFLNKKAPDLVVEKWLSKEPDRKGKFVLIDFWATWCGPCRKAIPELNAFHKKFGDKLVVIGISDEPESKVTSFTNPKIEYFSAIDTKAETKKAIEVSGIPHVIILDPQGIVRWEGFPLLNGYELTESVVKEIIDKEK